MDLKGTWGKIIAAVAIIATLAVVVAVGFYQEEVLGYFRLQGWNTQPAEQATKEFLDAAAKGDGKTVGRLTGQPSQWLDPIRSGDTVSGFNVMEYGGAKKYSLQQLVTNPDPQRSPPKLMFMDGGCVEVEASFPSYKLGLRWDNTSSGWKLKGITRTPGKSDG